MATIQELIQLVAEGDEEAQEQLNQALADLQQGKSVAERDLKLKTDKTLREKYPRALRAFDMGKLNLGTMSEDEMIQALAAKEDEYAALGAPIDSVVETVSEPAPAPAVDPAQALAGGVGSSGPAGTPRDYVHEYMELVTKGTTVHDQARANAILAELNKSGQKDKIRQITDALSARPILPSGM